MHEQMDLQDWSEFTDWPAPLGSWPVPDEDVQGRQWAQQIYLAQGAPWQLVRIDMHTCVGFPTIPVEQLVTAFSSSTLCAAHTHPASSTLSAGTWWA